MALNVNASTYLISVATSSVTITLAQADVGNNTMAVTNTGADPVYVFTSATSGTAVYPSSSATASQFGTVLPTGRHIVKLNPAHGFVNMIRKAAAATADVAIQVGADA